MTFTEEEDQLHRRARFHFVPFVARLLGSGPLRSASEPLPAGADHALTQETVEALQEILRRRVWGFLCREIGWKQLSYLPTNDGSPATNRLWNHPRHPNLEFSSRSIDLLLEAYAGTRDRVPRAGVEDLFSGHPARIDRNVGGCGTSNGDLILHHLVFRRFSEKPALGALPDDHSFHEWLGNPLNDLWLYDARGEDGVDVSWERLLQPDLQPWWPWILDLLVQHWEERIQSIEAVDHLPGRIGGLAVMLESLADFTEANERPDLLVPLFPLFLQRSIRTGSEERLLNTLVTSMRAEDRRRALLHWDRLLRLGIRLVDLRETLTGVHPIEREPSQDFYLRQCEEMDFAEVGATLTESSRRIIPRLG